VLAVPSAVVPQELNYLINPLHREFRAIQLPAEEPLQFDPRLRK
jgi:hypothetical protein